MLRTLVIGVTLSIVVGLLVRFAPLGIEAATCVVLGATVGAVLALNLDREPWQRALGFIVGVGLTWVGYAARAEILPDAPTGRGIAAFVVLLLVTAVTLVTVGRLPLWAGLLGVGAFAGSYESTFVADPTAFGTQSVVALTTLGLAASAAFIVTVVLAEALPGRVALPRQHVVDVRDPAKRSVEPPARYPHPVREPEEALRGPRVIDLPRDRR